MPPFIDTAQGNTGYNDHNDTPLRWSPVPLACTSRHGSTCSRTRDTLLPPSSHRRFAAVEDQPLPPEPPGRAGLAPAILLERNSSAASELRFRGADLTGLFFGRTLFGAALLCAAGPSPGGGSPVTSAPCTAPPAAGGRPEPPTGFGRSRNAAPAAR